MSLYHPPSFNKNSFNCSVCGVYAKQEWVNRDKAFGYHLYLQVAQCSHCAKYSYWHEKNLIYPDKSVAPLPHEDMPDSIIDDYQEAASILSRSPRGSAALLRLALQKLMVELGEHGKDINRDIGSLVSKGLNPLVQKSLDILRVIGNESVHPGTMNIKDNQEVATSLFGIINLIVQEQITNPKMIESIYASLPAGKLDGITQRDSR
ncbi:DUF4145 domain-containing protein [Jeotgalibacillus sp. S-D1]|uniref:DUF4145 domain-containing protein n=1 Tax=Jeotgalibacillus sp. S-D1 TaxID=2552189 RepID=UPI001059649A|nr:DUF4145 domain-containing protein [Jeotgalibacillus sp. S-D1]TDL34564.1 DUF4145 domain-containing protein [Jeotgalibacillus sp. S-D1]